MDNQIFIQKAIESIKNFAYINLGINQNNTIENIDDFIDENFSVIGTGKHELYFNKESFLQNQYIRQLHFTQTQFEIIDNEYHGHMITNDSCVIYGTIHLKEKSHVDKQLLIEMETRFTIVCKQVDEHMKIVHIHHSMPYLEQKENEYYPKTIAEKANEALAYSQYLEEIVELDALSELYNRIAIEQKVDQFLKNTQSSHALMMLDLDDFKHINDQYGHPVGDMVLIGIADILKKVFHDCAMIGRLGGDEFVIFIKENFHDDEIKKMINQIFDGCQTLAKLHQCHVDCSIGLAYSSPECHTFAKLFKKADKELYKNKLTSKSKDYL